MYCGAGILVGFLYVSESCQRYSNLGGVIDVGAGVRGYGLLVGGFHLWTALGRAELCDGAVEEVDLVVEVDDFHESSARHPSWSTVSYH
jgi:hypothetical protein